MIRLVDTLEAQRQLLAAIADQPAGQKLNLPRLRDALVSQADVIRGVEALIKAGDLDAATLRPATAGEEEDSTPALPAGDCGTSDDASAGVADVPPAHRTRQSRSKHVGPSGADLAAQIDALLDRDPSISKSAIGVALTGSPGGVERLRKVARPHAATIAKVAQLLADPPRSQAVDRLPRPYCKDPGSCTAPSRGPCRRCFVKTHARGSDRIRRSVRESAQRRIDQGLPAGSAASASVRVTQLAIQAQRATEARQADPVEQAKAILRRRFSPVCDAAVTGGPEGHFTVGRKIVDRPELLAMAARLAAVAAPPSTQSTSEKA